MKYTTAIHTLTMTVMKLAIYAAFLDQTMCFFANIEMAMITAYATTATLNLKTARIQHPVLYLKLTTTEEHAPLLAEKMSPKLIF